MFYPSPAILHHLTTRVLCDEAPAHSPIEAVYIFGLTKENQESSLATAAELWRRKQATMVLSCRGETAHGDAGYAFRERWLLERGVYRTALRAVEIPTETNVNTHTEAVALVTIAKKFGWHGVYAASSPFHQLRAFVTTVSVALRMYPDLKVYSKTGNTMAWGEQTRHSQDTLIGTRADFIGTELDRLNQYHRQGNLVGAMRVIEYLDRRDT